jgi:hypothetical protein
MEDDIFRTNTEKDSSRESKPKEDPALGVIIRIA